MHEPTPEDVARRVHVDRVGRRVSTALLLIGLAWLVLAIFAGASGWIPGAVAAALVGPGGVMVAAGIGVGIGVRQSRRRRGQATETVARPAQDRQRYLRRLTVGVTGFGLLVVVVIWFLVPAPAAATVSVLMILVVADLWYVDRRLRRTGRI